MATHSVFLSGKSHGQRRLVDYSPWGCKSVGHDLTTKQQIYIYVCVCVSQSISQVTLRSLQDCSPPSYSVHGILQTRILKWVTIPFSRGIFWTQRLNPGLLHCRLILYCLSHQGSPYINVHMYNICIYVYKKIYIFLSGLIPLLFLNCSYYIFY